MDVAKWPCTYACLHMHRTHICIFSGLVKKFNKALQLHVSVTYSQQCMRVAMPAIVIFLWVLF